MADETPPPNPTTPDAPPAASAAPPPSPPAAPGAAAPPALTIPLDEYRRFLGQSAELERVRAESAAAAERKEAERLRALAEKGQAEEALKQQRESWESRLRESDQRFATLESQILEERRGAAVGQALAGARFVSADAARQAAALLAPQFEAVRNPAGAVEVRDRTTLKPAAEVVAAALASPAYAHFLEPSSRGGAGGGGNQPPPAPPAAPPQTEGQRLIDEINRLGLKPGANPLAFPTAARN